MKAFLIIFALYSIFLLSSCKESKSSGTETKNIPTSYATSVTADDRYNLASEITDPPLIKAVSDLALELDNLLILKKIVGGEILLIKDNDILLHQVSGWDNKSLDQKLELNRIDKISGLTTTIIHTAILLLYENGMLDLCDAVAKYIPSFDNDKSRDITIEQLLRHSSGLSQEAYSKNLIEYDSLAQAIDEVGITGPDKAPDTIGPVNHKNTDILALIITIVSGQSYQDYIENSIFVPLGMAHSFFHLSEHTDLTPLVNSRYKKNENGEIIRTWDNSLPEDYHFQWPSTSAYSTISDISILVSLWINKGELNGLRLLSESLVQKWMILGHTPLFNNDTSQCLIDTINLDNIDYTPVTTFGYHSGIGPIFYAIPKHKIVAIYFTQSFWYVWDWSFWRRMYTLNTKLDWR